MRYRAVIFSVLVLCMTASIWGGTGQPAAEAKSSVSVSAESAVVMDVQSGTILYQKNMDKKEYPASITKIMTALLAIENSSLSETVTYSKEAVTNLEYKASNIEIQPGEKLSMENSLYGILMMSANEACNGVAEHVAGSIDNFVDMMNARAKELGCTGTHFANANGLWMKNHYTTAHDMAIIARTAYRNPTFAKITGTKTYVIPKTNKYGKRWLYNHHGMLYAFHFPQYLYEYCVGGKTGYTDKCRYTLVTYAKKGNMTLLSVVMRVPKSPYEEPNEYTDSTKLLNYGFNKFHRVSILNDATKEVNEKHLFTKFSPFFNKDMTALSVDSNAGVILPKNVKLSDTKKTVEYYSEPQTSADGKTAIGKIVYTYKGSEVGGSEIYYQKKTQSVSLTDSINMDQWFEDAVEKANTKPFSWIWIVLIVVGAALVVGGTVFLVLRFRAEKEMRARRNRYKKTHQNMKNSKSEMLYRKNK